MFLQKPNRLLFYFDEGRFGLQSTLTGIWAKKGVPLLVKVKQGYTSFYTYSAVSPHTGESFSLFLPEVNTDMMNVYLRELSQEFSDKEIMIVMDQAGWHRSKHLEIPDRIRIEYLSPYSPELNPVEKLWQWLRQEKTHNKVFEKIDALMDALAQGLNNLQEKDMARLCHCSYL